MSAGTSTIALVVAHYLHLCTRLAFGIQICSEVVGLHRAGAWVCEVSFLDMELSLDGLVGFVLTDRRRKRLT